MQCTSDLDSLVKTSKMINLMISEAMIRYLYLGSCQTRRLIKSRMGWELTIIKYMLPRDSQTYSMIHSTWIEWIKDPAKALEIQALELLDQKEFSMKHLLDQVLKSMRKRNQLIESNSTKKDKTMSYKSMILLEIIKIFQMID